MIKFFENMKLGRNKYKFQPASGNTLRCPHCYSTRLKHWDNSGPYIAIYRCRECGGKTVYDRVHHTMFKADNYSGNKQGSGMMQKLHALKEKRKQRFEEQRKKKLIFTG